MPTGSEVKKEKARFYRLLHRLRRCAFCGKLKTIYSHAEGGAPVCCDCCGRYNIGRGNCPRCQKSLCHDLQLTNGRGCCADNGAHLDCCASCFRAKIKAAQETVLLSISKQEE